jgi:hypothetical protein
MLLLEIGQRIVSPHRRCDAIAAVQHALRHDPSEAGRSPENFSRFSRAESRRGPVAISRDNVCRAIQFARRHGRAMSRCQLVYQRCVDSIRRRSASQSGRSALRLRILDRSGHDYRDTIDV